VDEMQIKKNEKSLPVKHFLFNCLLGGEK